MSRTTVLMGLTGLVLLAGTAGLGTGAATAEPLADRESVCLRLDPEGGREGVCVYLKLPDRP